MSDSSSEKISNTSATASIAIEPDAAVSPNYKLSETINGINLIENFISELDEAAIMRELDSGEWTEEMSRRVQVLISSILLTYWKSCIFYAALWIPFQL